MGRDIGLWDMSCDCEHHRNRVFGCGDGIAIGRIHHDHTFCATAFDVNIVDANTCTPHHLQVGGICKQRRRHLRC